MEQTNHRRRPRTSPGAPLGQTFEADPAGATSGLGGPKEAKHFQQHRSSNLETCSSSCPSPSLRIGTQSPPRANPDQFLDLRQAVVTNLQKRSIISEDKTSSSVDDDNDDDDDDDVDGDCGGGESDGDVAQVTIGFGVLVFLGGLQGFLTMKSRMSLASLWGGAALFPGARAPLPRGVEEEGRASNRS